MIDIYRSYDLLMYVHTLWSRILRSRIDCDVEDIVNCKILCSRIYCGAVSVYVGGVVYVGGRVCTCEAV